MCAVYVYKFREHGLRDEINGIFEMELGISHPFWGIENFFFDGFLFCHVGPMLSALAVY